MYLLHLTETGLGKSRDLPKDSQEISDRAGVSIYLFLCKNPPSIIDSAADRVISEHSAMFIFSVGGIWGFVLSYKNMVSNVQDLIAVTLKK